MDNSNIKIKDIYVGRPDAKDEIHFDGIEDFVHSYVVPEFYDIEGLLKGNNCFITGYKGTGKTALLFYLEYLIKRQKPYSCTSFIFFKDGFTETRKQELEGFSKRISSFVAFEESSIIDNLDFEHIWRWLFYKRIISDNEEYSNNLFIDDENWRSFKSIVDRIKAPTDKIKSIIPPKIKIGSTIKDSSSMNEITPELEVDFTQNKNNKNYATFINLIDQAETKLCFVKRTDTPYYIFVDELEAYYGDEVIFKRDLRFIRDLIFTVKRMNEIFIQIGNETKIICSARTEILNAISRFVVSKEMNKVINGFEIPIIWNYTTTSSFQHPIIQVLLKRIAIACNDEFDYKSIYNKWFPEKIHDIEPAAYILNNSWNKPRDIVRLISSAQSSIKKNNTSFNKSVFDSLRKKYSEDSLVEIREELRSLYTTEEIEDIITCFTGFKTVFSYNRLKERIKNYFSETILNDKLNQILQDLYRLGFLGNYLPASQSYRWQHKGDNSIIFSPEWRIMIHYALHSALSLNAKQNYGLTKYEEPEKGDMVNAKVVRVLPYLVLVEFSYKNKNYDGFIRINKLGMGYVKNIFRAVKIGEEYRAQVLRYNGKHSNWELRLDFQTE